MITDPGKFFAVSLGKLQKCCFPSYLELEGRSTEGTRDEQAHFSLELIVSLNAFLKAQIFT